jgi:DegV family protein with EDD domain
MASDLGVVVVPLTIMFGAESFLDGVDISVAAFYERMRAFSGLPTTSQPSVERFRAAYESCGEGAEIVSIHISSKMSGTLNSASVAREQAGAADRIDLVDSYSVSLGLGIVVVEAARAAAAGASRPEVVAVARDAAKHVRVVAAVDTLEYLRRGGRIGRARSLLGSLLSIKPLLQIEDGEMAPFERVRTRTRALDRLAEIATSDPTVRRMAVAAAGDDETARRLYERIAPALPGTEMMLGAIGPIVGVHAGPGLVGICSLGRA